MSIQYLRAGVYYLNFERNILKAFCTGQNIVASTVKVEVLAVKCLKVIGDRFANRIANILRANPTSSSANTK